jgi:hypothetical protein
MTDKIAGKSFCFTGTGSKPRAELQALVRKHGGIVKTNVSSTLDYLVVGDTGCNGITNKQFDAVSLDVKVISDAKFLAMTKPKDAMSKPKKTAKSKKPARKTVPEPEITPHEYITDYYMSKHMWEAVDRSISYHNMQPASENGYHAIQLEATKTWRVNELMEALYDTMDYHYNTPMKDLKGAPDLDEVIEELYLSHADEVVHEYMDATDADKYLVPHNPATCSDCKQMKEEKAALLKHLTEEAAKEKAEAGQNDDVDDDLEEEDEDESEEDSEPDEVRASPEKTSALTSLAMFGSALLGAGIVSAASKGAGASSVRIATENAADVDVVEVASKTMEAGS